MAVEVRFKGVVSRRGRGGVDGCRRKIGDFMSFKGFQQIESSVPIPLTPNIGLAAIIPVVCIAEVYQ